MDANKLVCSVVGCLTRMVYGGEFRKIRVSVSFIHQKHMSLTCTVELDISNDFSVSNDFVMVCSCTWTGQ